MFGHLLLPELRELIELNDLAGLAEFLDALHPATSAEVLENVSEAEAWMVLASAPFERQAEVFGYFNPAFQTQMVENVARGHLSKLMETMAPDDRVDLLKSLDSEHVEALLPLMAQAQRNDIRRLLSYPDGSAGSIMTTDYASLPENITVAEALDQLRRQAPDRETIYYIYILDDDRKLDGFVTLRTLILARPNAHLSDIMARDVFAVRVDDDQLLLSDNCEGAAYDSNKWIQALTSFTVVQTAAAGMNFNNGASVTTTQGAMQLSHRFFPIPKRSGLVFSCKARAVR